nr:CoA-disulfide reductase [uncultured Rothia sp.]
MKPTPIPIGDSVFYYRLILRGLLYIWVPLAVVFIGVPIVVVTIAYLIGLFPNHRGNLPDFALSPLAVVLLIVGAIAVGSLVYLQNRIISAIIANNVYFYFWDIYGSKKGARDSKDAYSERLAAKTYADQLFLGQQEFAQQFRENMYMAGIQEIDEYPRVLSDSVMLPHNYRVVKTREAEDPEDRIDRFVNWVRSKIGFERLEPRIIYTLEHKDAHKDAKKEAHGEPVATEQPVSGQSVSEQPAEAQDAQKAAEVPASEEPIVAEVPVEAPAEDPADAPTEPVTGGATDSSAAAGADDPTEAFTRIPEDAVDHESAGEKNAGEKPSTEKPKN